MMLGCVIDGVALVTNGPVTWIVATGPLN